MGKVNGVDALIRKFRTMSAQVQKEAKIVIGDVASDIAAQAMANQNQAKGQRFFVGDEIINNGYTAVIFVSGGGPGTKKSPLGNLAAYREFGQGASAAAYVPTLPREWQEMARRYYEGGTGKMVKQPFLYPAVVKHVPEITKGLRAVLVKAIK